SRSRTQSNAKYTVSKLNFVDLAGSERLGKSKSEGKTKEEAMYINKSLSFLEQVVIALASRTRDHVPFRQSKLTHYLKDSIGGGCGTVLVANMWGEKPQLEETVSTLRFATRMMCVASEPCVNEVYDPVLLVKKLQQEVKHLRAELAMHDTLTNRSLVSYEPLSEQQRYDIRGQVRRYLAGQLSELEVINLRQILATYDAFKEIYWCLEKEMEDSLNEKYMLVNKNDPAAISEAIQVPLPFFISIQEITSSVVDERSMVGELEGGTFGIPASPQVSRADSSSFVTFKQKERDKRKMSQRTMSILPSIVGRASPVMSASQLKAETPLLSSDKRDLERDTELVYTPGSSLGNITEKTPRTSTPPSRTSAFEEFKADKGSEINRILIENKEILVNKKKTYSELANEVNKLKYSIDQTREKLEQLKAQREADGPIFNDDGDIIISEAEYLEIQKLKELKTSYRSKYDELHNVRAEIMYCQKLVDQCRLRLIQ
ncbi:unnamed protein product, partial [Candidula unifasciata]